MPSSATGDGTGDPPSDSREASGLSAGEAARRLGVAVTTLRTWDQRYGVGPSVRERGRHRRYHAEDLNRLQAMRRMIADGVAPAEAARIILTSSHPGHSADPPAPPRPAADLMANSTSGLRRAALTLDTPQMDRILTSAVADDVVAAWTSLISPVLRSLGTKHARTGKHIEAEHLLSWAVTRALAQIVIPSAPPTVLLACTPEEEHTLPLEALVAALATRGIASRLLGAKVPGDSLEAAVRRTGPTAVILWAHSSATARTAALQQLLRVRPRPPLIAVAGPGWTHSTLPDNVVTLQDLPHALTVLAAYLPLRQTPGSPTV